VASSSNIIRYSNALDGEFDKSAMPYKLCAVIPVLCRMAEFAQPIQNGCVDMRQHFRRGESV